MRSLPAALVPFALIGFTLLGGEVRAQSAEDTPVLLSPKFADTESQKPAVVAMTAPADTREVTATGTAAIEVSQGAAGVLMARRAAEAQALRNAVEKALGVYVAARTLTQNYQLVRDTITTRADGFATKKQTLKEVIGPQTVTVTLRAVVSLRPLADELRTLKLTRAFRVRVTGPEKTYLREANPLAGAVPELEQTLTQAGFVVVSSAKEADVTVRLSPQFADIADIAVDGGNIPLTMHSVRCDLTARAVRTGTDEVVAAFTASDTALHIDTATARWLSAGRSTVALAPRLADALLVLPASASQPVEVVVSRLASATQAARLEDALNTVMGVQNVLRRGYVSGTATYELDINSDAVALLARALEQSALLKPFHLTVARESRARIVATAGAR